MTQRKKENKREKKTTEVNFGSECVKNKIKYNKP
jgi:hypothetical protein